MIKIIADSTSDLSDDILKRYDIDVLPLYIHLGEMKKTGSGVIESDIFAAGEEDGMNC